MSFVHLHTHSEYSLLDGMCRLDDLIAKAKEFEMPAVAVTDHGALYSAFKFYIKAKDAGIKPIIGVELYKAKGSRLKKSRERYHLLAIAKSYEGYKNLMKLVSYANLDGFYYKPRIDWELLKKYHTDIILTSGCLQGEIPKLLLQDQYKQAEEVLEKYLELFEGNYYIELQRHPNLPEQDKANERLVKLARKYAVPILATNDVHYLEKDDAYAQEVLLCIQTQRAIFEKNRPLSMIDVPDFYFKSPEEMKAAFHDYPEAIENSLRIAEQCNLEIPYGKLILPKYELPRKMTQREHLEELIAERKTRVQEFDQDVVENRIKYELDIIDEKGYIPYFLFIQDVVNWAKDNGIAVGPGRGSAAGSLISYILRITNINPLEYNLPFERFLNPERPTPPDIDIDFSDRRREEVIQYISKKYGEDHVAQVITFGTMESRMAIRDVARALGYSYAQGDRIAKMIPPPKQGFNISISEAIDQEPALKLAYAKDSDVKKILDVAQKVESLPRHFSVHAAALVVADKPLIEYVPIQRDNKDGKVITQFDMYSLDLNAVSEDKAIGLVKADILGLRNLSILEEAIDFVEESTGKRIDIYDIPLDDEKTYKLISAGHTVGVFQLESGGMRRVAKELQPNKMSDITAMVALYRPGPMELIPEFIKNKKNPVKIKYMHKDLKEVLEETYGILVYQDQVTEIAVALAGMSNAEADILRMAVGKKKKKLMKKVKKQFLEGAVKKGYRLKVAEDIFGFIEKFASYGFNKAHSASYGLIAYWTAYMKANYQVEYMTALLTAALQGAAGPQKEAKVAQAIEEARRMSIEVLPPDINKSVKRFSIEGRSIRFGLTAIKNVGSAAIESILEAREKDGPFTSFSDFLYRVNLRKVNKKTVESLIKSGAFDVFDTRATFLTHYPAVVQKVSSYKDQIDSGQFGLFSTNDQKRFKKDNVSHVPEFGEAELINFEKEVIGFLLSRDPMDKHSDILKEKVTKHVADLVPGDTKKTYILGGILTRVKVVKTKKNNSEMAFVNINDSTGTIEAIMFPKTYNKYKNMLELNNVLLFKGSIESREGTQSVIIKQLVNLDKRT